MIDFAYKLRELRKLRGWSQEELANRLGVSRSKIGNYEQGTREPGFEDLEAFADIFNCTIAFLVDSDRVGPDEYYEMLQIAHLRPEENELIEKYRQLNFVGKKEIERYFDYVLTRPDYRRESESDASSDVS